jgi:CubicO group peptidase (beta-lactamase class C family)
MHYAALVALLLCLLLVPRPAIRAADDPRFDRLVDVVSAKMQEYQVPGVAVGVLHDGTTSVRGLGVTNLDHPQPVTADTLFQVGSISKTFAGTVMMRFVEQGRVNLDAPVRTYIPAFKVRDAAASRDARVIDLLTHMGGWEGDVFEDQGEGEDALAKYVARMADLEQVAPLRTVWSYNNAGFVVAGHVIEKVTGGSYERALADLVLGPLGLKQTYIFPADVMTRRFAVGHGGEKPAVLRPWPIGRYAHPAGGVISTAPDLLKYAQFHMGDGSADQTRVVSAATLRRMHSTVLVKHGMDDEMAITWHVSNGGGVRSISHGGSTLGQQAQLTLVPERRFAMALLTNSTRGGRLNQDVLKWALKEYLQVENPDPEPMATQPDITTYVGRYSRPYADVVVETENGRLTFQSIQKRGFPNASAPVPPPGPKVPIAFYKPDRAIVTEGQQKGGRVEFIRRPGGSIGWVRVGGRILRRGGATS